MAQRDAVTRERAIEMIRMCLSYEVSVKSFYDYDEETLVIPTLGYAQAYFLQLKDSPGKRSMFLAHMDSRLAESLDECTSFEHLYIKFSIGDLLRYRKKSLLSTMDAHATFSQWLTGFDREVRDVQGWIMERQNGTSEFVKAASDRVQDLMRRALASHEHINRTLVSTPAISSVCGLPEVIKIGSLNINYIQERLHLVKNVENWIEDYALYTVQVKQVVLSGWLSFLQEAVEGVRDVEHSLQMALDVSSATLMWFSDMYKELLDNAHVFQNESE